MKRLLPILLLTALALGSLQPRADQPGAYPTRTQAPAPGADRVIAEAYAAQRSNVQVHGQGTVIKLLKDDREGRQHQRFLLRLANGHTLLVAHNIELAGRVPVQVGDPVAFFGEYEWNPKGGVVHWTHHDPRRTHIDGWLKHHGNTYQ